MARVAATSREVRVAHLLRAAVIISTNALPNQSHPAPARLPTKISPSSAGPLPVEDLPRGYAARGAPRWNPVRFSWMTTPPMPEASTLQSLTGHDNIKPDCVQSTPQIRIKLRVLKRL